MLICFPCRQSELAAEQRVIIHIQTRSTITMLLKLSLILKLFDVDEGLILHQIILNLKWDETNFVGYIAMTFDEDHSVSIHRQLVCLFHKLASLEKNKNHGSTLPILCEGVPLWQVDSLLKGPIMWKALPCHGVIVATYRLIPAWFLFENS